MRSRLAAEGHTLLMSNVFYRTGRPPLFDFPRRSGEERTMKRFAELMEPPTLDVMGLDIADYVDFLVTQASLAEGQMSVVGYCFTGAMAVIRTTAVWPDRIAAAASFHGGGLYSDKP